MSFDEQFESEMEPPKHGFQIIRKAKRQKVTQETYPEVLQMSGEFDKEIPETKPQALFFNRDNKNAPYKYVSPWDFNFVKNLMHRQPRPNFSMNGNPLADKYRDSIEGVTRAFEEKYMVEASGDQRPCVMEEACEGRCIPQSPHKIVLREFLLPSQEKHYEETRRYPIERAPCILCKRLQIAHMVVSARAENTGLRDDCLVQDYYNFVNIPGEYDLKDCLLSKRTVWEGLVSPVVLHVRNAYKFVMKDGKRGYTQWKMPFLTVRPEENSGITHSSASTC
jgi:hypothetical protein